ncbi:MAG: hypothetical protein JOZ07_12780 [Solirubrobacterales bacterium]|nr:hypothetical protein [Solirubrobacterales bacterium]
MARLWAPLSLAVARARRAPGRWTWPALGLILAAAFACAVAAEATIAGDRAARDTLRALGPAQRTVTITIQGPADAGADRRARALLAGLGLPAPTETILLNPVRLSGVVVRPAAINPLRRWTAKAPAQRCRARACPMLLVGGSPGRRVLSAAGVRIVVAGRRRLRSAAVLGFEPAPRGQPVLVTGDLAGLQRLAALSGIYRATSWVTEPSLAQLHSWELAADERRLNRVQAQLAAGLRFSLTAPLTTLDQARAQAATAPRRLLPAGGGALAGLAVFVVLAAYGLRRSQRPERDRLRAAGARTWQLATFSLAEAACLSAFALLAGAAVGMVATAVLADRAGLPAGAVLAHSLLRPLGVVALVGGWLVATAVIGAVLTLPDGRILDALSFAAAAALALALTAGGAGSDTLALLAPPLACVAAAGVVFRATARLLRGGERLARRGPVVVRLAIVGLARSPTAPALAVAVTAVSTGLAGFAIGYHATLRRAAADQAAQSVPLDAIVGQSASFTRPFAVASLQRWRELAGGGTVLPVRETDASLPLHGNNITLPALGVPAAGLPLIRGWRTGQGSAPLPVLARRLAPRGPVRTPGPVIPAGARRLRVALRAPGGEVIVTADLRDRAGAVTRIGLGPALARLRLASARVPRGGPYELEALELDEPSGEAATNGHQNAENPAAGTQAVTAVRIGPVSAGGRTLVTSWRGWRGVGAATLRTVGGRIAFSDDGDAGVLRPRQPSDVRAVPVLVDAATAAGAGPAGQLPLTVDGEPVNARVVGVVRRFPTIAADQPGFVIADEATLAGALDASSPGQGAADELWIATRHPAALRAALRSPRLAPLSSSFRADERRRLDGDPIARGLLGTLVAAAAVAGALAICGLLVALLGAMRDARAERDLVVLGLGPRELGRELALRALAAGILGTVAGVVLAAALTLLVVAAVRAAGGVAVPDPPVVAVAPWGRFALLAGAALAAFALVAQAAALAAARGRR